MLAEKFFLVLETLRSHASDGEPQLEVQTTPHVPFAFPRWKLVKDRAKLASEEGIHVRAGP